MIGRSLMILGAVLFAAGLLIHLGRHLAGRLSLPLGRLPGDIVIRGKHTTFYFPLMSCLLLSLLLLLATWILRRR